MPLFFVTYYIFQNFDNNITILGGDIIQIEFTVPGKPIGKGRPKFARRGKYVTTYTPQRTRDYESYVLKCWRDQSHQKYPKGTPLEVSIHGHFPIPKGTSKVKRESLIGEPYTHKCDVDNLAKGILDAISGQAFYDDAEIYSLTITKDYARDEGSTDVIISADGVEPHTIIRPVYMIKDK